MSDFMDIFQEVLRIVTVQPRESRMRYEFPQHEERIQARQKQIGDNATAVDPRGTSGKGAGFFADLTLSLLTRK